TATTRHGVNLLQTVVEDLFFFSSRRRHTRSKRDWSSDVCSSDLDIPMQRQACREFAAARGWKIIKEFYEKGISGFKTPTADRREIGRASCRERGSSWGGGGSAEGREGAADEHSRTTGVGGGRARR